MRIRRGAALLAGWLSVTAACFSVANVAAAEPANDSADLELRYQAEIAAAERRGRRLFEHDRAGWVATDLMFQVAGRNQSGKIVGWIEEEIGDELIRVIFYQKENDSFRPVYSIDVADGVAIVDSFTAHPSDAKFTDPQLDIVKARDLGARQKFDACSRNYNTVVFPAEDGGHFVYLLATTTVEGEVVVGGHYRIHIDAAGENVIGFEKFTNTCFSLNKPKLAKNDQLVTMMMTHLLTDYPSEIHVFVSLQHEIDLYVVTVNNGAMWSVSNGKISFVNRD